MEFRGVLYWLKPLVFPIKQTTGLTSVMGASVATGLEMHSLVDPTAADLWTGIIARLMSTLVNTELLAAELEHFWHKRHAVEASVPVERGKDLLFAADLD